MHCLQHDGGPQIQSLQTLFHYKNTAGEGGKAKITAHTDYCDRKETILFLQAPLYRWFNSKEMSKIIAQESTRTILVEKTCWEQMNKQIELTY